MKKFITLFMSLLLCMTMCLVVSAEETHIHAQTEPLTFDALVELAAVSYPTCSNCGGTTRNFNSTGSSSHNVRCRNCDYLLTTESCWALSEATCESPSLCICNRELEQPTGHCYYIGSISMTLHGQLCSNSGCRHNPYSYNYSGPFYSQAHNINYAYGDYLFNNVGPRYHTKSGTCGTCLYDYYDTTPCLIPNAPSCHQANVCFGDVDP